MASEMQKEKPLEELLQNLKVNSSTKLGDATVAAAKDGNPSDATSCISSLGDATFSIKESDVDLESLTTEPGIYYPSVDYYGYYYPGYDGSFGEWDDQGYFIGGDGLEIQYPAIQTGNGSFIYYMPGCNYNQPGYSPYGPYGPGALIGVGGQYLGQQPYYPSPIYTQPLASPGYFPSPVPYGSEIMPAYPWDSSPLFLDALHGNGFGGSAAILGSKPNLSALSPILSPHPKSTPAAKSSTQLETKGCKSASDVPPVPGNISVIGGYNESLKPVNKVPQHGSGFQTAAVLAKGYFPVAKFPSYSNNPINFKGNGRGWSGTDKLKTRGKGNGINDLDLLNEQNRGPRTNGAHNPWVPKVDAVGSQGSKDNGNNDRSASIIKRDQYNLPDFATNCDLAHFFVIKSYSEDDIHKSIKYNVWASTPNGNKRLDSAYQDAKERVRDTGGKCPVLLFFSVNASGQFCGVAEMIGRVDFNKSMDFWQQDKWNGYFPVKWHFIKDIPNPQFRHIILKNNDHKPVTNSRDTQQVKFLQGIEMLDIFKNYSSKTSILDDFEFYEGRQKAMQDKRTRLPTPHMEQQREGDLMLDNAALQLTAAVAVKMNDEELPVSVVEVNE